jgi:hypothetical protein
MSNDPTDGAGPRGTLPLGVGPIPSPAAPQPSREARMTVPARPRPRPRPALLHSASEGARPSVRRAGVWPAPSRILVGMSRRRAWLAVDLAVAVVALAIGVGVRVELRGARPAGARAAPAIELHQERELPERAELRGSVSSASALRASAEARPPPARAAPPASTLRAAPAKRSKAKGDVVDPWEK